MDGKTMRNPWWSGISLLLGMLLLVGCASTNVVLSREKVAQGEKDLSEARASSASLGAPAELEAAEAKLSLAKEALAKDEYEKARRLAEEASVDAEYARAKSTAEKYKITAEQMKNNIESLRREIEYPSR